MFRRNRYSRLLATTGMAETQPTLEHSAAALAAIAAVVVVIGTGIWVGLFLRKKRLGTYRSPYESRRFLRGLDDFGEYEAVGI